MIGSLMSRMGTAQKLSVAQLKQAVQDGTLPAYVGIPLIQDKLKQQQEAQAGKPVPPQPPIADQILQEADQSRGIDEAQSNLPTMNAAEGGIISYALGGDVEDDYEDQLQEEADSQDLGYAQMMAQANENEGMLSAKEPSYVNKTPSVGFGIKPPTGGVDALLSHIISKESGGRDYDEKGRPLTSNKGAKFAMQVLDSTAKDPGFGIKPAKDMTAAEYNRVGKELATALLDKYQDPKLAAIAYNWGAGNTDKWLANGANPQKLPKETQGYLVGANFADGGIVALAAGGAVPHFDGTDGSQVPAADYSNNPYMQRVMANQQAISGIGNNGIGELFKLSNWDPVQSSYRAVNNLVMQPWNRFIHQSPEEQAVIDNIGKEARTGERPTFVDRPEDTARDQAALVQAKQSAVTRAAAEKAAAVAAKSNTATSETATSPNAVSPQDLMMLANFEGFNGDQLTIKPPSKESAQDTTKAPTELSAWDKYLQGITEERQSLKEQKEEDKYLSLMAAGLGILKTSGTVEPGKVHTAIGDIATGGMEGVAYYANAAKQRAAQQAALNKELGLGMYRQEIAKATAGNKGIDQQLRQDALNEQKNQHANQNFLNAVKFREVAWDKDINNATKSEAEKNAFIYGHPTVQGYAKTAGMDIDSLMSTPTPIIVKTPDGKSYKFNDQASADKFKQTAGIQ
jgi:hypothetical protein